VVRVEAHPLVLREVILKISLRFCVQLNLSGIDGCGCDSSGDETQGLVLHFVDFAECMAAAAGNISVQYSMAGLM
jgi:hypothetical protein